MSDRRIVTGYPFPPIPDRRFDWCAWREGNEEARWEYGWGPTEQEAIADMLRLEQERAECEDDQLREEYERQQQ